MQKTLLRLVRGTQQVFLRQRARRNTPSQVEVLQKIVKQFALEFVKHPYACYTEHGLHALFYTTLYNALAPEQRYVVWNNYKVCAVQKEYPTADALGKPRRQHWDIALIKAPPTSLRGQEPAYDYLRLAAVVEFGMNEAEAHLLDDIDRVCHANANVEQAYVVHLYRLSKPGALLSGRDWTSDSTRIVSKERVAELVRQKPAEVIYGLYDSTGQQANGVWQISRGTIARVQG